MSRWAWLMNQDGTVSANISPAGALKVDASATIQPVSVSGVTPLATAPGSDTGQTAIPVRIISQLGAGAGGASGGLTNTELRATPVPVSGTVSVGTVPVIGTVAVSNLPATQAVSGAFWQTTQPVSGPLTDTQLRASVVPVSLASTTVTGSVAVTGPATDTQLRATPLPVSGTVTATGPLTDTQLRASAVPVSLASTTVTGSVAVTGPITDTQIRASALPVSLASLPALASMAAASSAPTGVVSLGNTLGKTNVMKTGSLASSAATADQVILTYTVTSGKTFYLEYLEFSGRLTTFATTATLLGSISLETPSGTKVYTTDLVTAGNQNNVVITFSEPIAIAAGVVVRVVCTPSAVTPFTWKANFGGYEK